MNKLSKTSEEGIRFLTMIFLTTLVWNKDSYEYFQDLSYKFHNVK